MLNEQKDQQFFLSTAQDRVQKLEAALDKAQIDASLAVLCDPNSRNVGFSVKRTS